MGLTRVLVVDDDALVRSILSDLLTENGFAATVAESAEAALALIQAQPFEVLLTDLNLPLANGLQLMHVCRTVAPNLQTVAMSAYASAADYKTARRLGAVELLVKPFRLEEAIEAVRRAEHRRPGYRASFDGLSLADVLQMCHQLRKSVTVQIDGVGAAYFDEGELVHVEAGQQSGVPALVTLLGATGWELKVEAPALVARTVTGSFANMLLEAMTTLESLQARRSGVELPEGTIDAALEALETPAAGAETPRRRGVVRTGPLTSGKK
jgi:CheY-like chemotaxis protein